LITADHGNAEQKINPQTGEISTEHTSNLVPFIAINNILQGKYTKLPQGILADVAPTVLALLGIPKPETMTGRNLLEDIN
jgi:2,3-bisphosphoglycerate-independent phosphoglycerate mutase